MPIDPASTLVIANPAAAGGRVGRTWKQSLRQGLADALGPVSFALTEHAAHAPELAEQAVRDGMTTVISLGGDGTHGAIASGLLAAEPEPGAVTLGVLHAGTGGDFRRMLDLPKDPVAAAKLLATAEATPIDLGRLSYVGADGTPQTRTFLNECSVGMPGDVCKRVNASSKRLGGKATFLIATIRAMRVYKAPLMQLTVDGRDCGEHAVSALFIANGQWAGGGMQFAPNARLDDGMFDITVIHEASFLRQLTQTPSLYDGTLLEADDVASERGRVVEVAPVGSDTAWIEADGEPLGLPPLRAEVVPHPINLLGPIAS